MNIFIPLRYRSHKDFRVPYSGAHFYVRFSFQKAASCALCSALLYSVRQLHHVCRVNAEEDIQDFRQLRPGLDSPQVVVLFIVANPIDSGVANQLTNHVLQSDM